MTRRPTWRLCAIAVLAFGVAIRAQALPFEPGEEMKLSVSFLSIGVGEVTISTHEQVEGGVRLWATRMAGKTHGFAASMYKLDSSLTSKFDPITQRTVGSESSEIIGDVHKTDDIHIDGTTALIHRTYNESVSDETRTIPPGSMDILGAVFALRARSVSSFTELRIPVFTGHKNWDMVARLVGHETIKTDAGTFDTLVLHCQTFFDGKFATHGNLTVWLSNDARRIPVRIDAPFALGTMRTTLTSFHAGPIARN